MPKRLEVIEATAPSAWASYLINGDDSGIEEGERREADAFVAFVAAGAPVGCEDAGFMWYSNARDWGCTSTGADCQTYSFLR